MAVEPSYSQGLSKSLQIHLEELMLAKFNQETIKRQVHVDGAAHLEAALSHQNGVCCFTRMPDRHVDDGVACPQRLSMSNMLPEGYHLKRWPMPTLKYWPTSGSKRKPEPLGSRLRFTSRAVRDT